MARLILVQDFPSGGWLRFRPFEVRSLNDASQVRSRLEEAEARVEQQGCHAVVFLTFECAPAFDAAFPSGPASILPAAWIALCEAPSRLTWDQVTSRLSPSPAPAPTQDGRQDPQPQGTGPDPGAPQKADSGRPDARPASPSLPPALDWKPDWTFEQYGSRVECVRRAIAEGETYQVNLTFPLRAELRGSARRLFLFMTEAQRASCCAYLEDEDWVICSASPELFLWRQGNQILTRPMKGTAPRGRTRAEDQQQSKWLAASEKNRAENLMIADMMRNDLGRVAETGSVHVDELFHTERYPTLWQMTSSVSARSQASTAQLLAATFPPASITGAPKVAACRLISQLEEAPRGIYTGCIGYLAPGRRAQFNVAIRTVTVDRHRSQAVYGVGSGIVADSDAGAEYRECLLKAEVLTQRPPDFRLLETMLWRRGKIFLLEEHLRRLSESARYFDFAFSRRRVLQDLGEACAGLDRAGSAEGPQRLRLLMDRRGETSVEATPLDIRQLKRPLVLGLAPRSVDSSDPFLCHKTTHRAVYERALASRPDCDDVILYNENGQVTETALGNLLVCRDNGWVTPPLECGLLAGTMRHRLLSRGTICEAPVKVEELCCDPSRL
ncbi:MAG TPA: aminodeoxychorismate synthase component I, partial [Acidobacteriota bacterium]|nr:aminodeoxychorismate synthase component I [Acidobacteriota bacterium]